MTNAPSFHDEHPVLAGHALVLALTDVNTGLEPAYPPAHLDDDKLEAIKEFVIEAMPRGSMMLDLWNWDCHFEEDLEDDWLYGSASGQEQDIGDRTQELTDYFLAKVTEYGMDYDQHADSDAFAKLVADDAELFIVQWRRRICAQTFRPEILSLGSAP